MERTYIHSFYINIESKESLYIGAEWYLLILVIAHLLIAHGAKIFAAVGALAEGLE